MDVSDVRHAAARNVILIGGSLGSIAVIKTLLSGFTARFRAAIGITIHRSPTFVSELAEVFGARSELPVVEAANGQLFQPGVVYLAPRDHHLVFRSGAVWLDRGPKQHFARPAIDVMFSSGASAYGPRVIGVLLTGNMSDGVAGLIAIKRHGGLSLAQDPDEAEAPSMPLNALAYDDVDGVFSARAGSELIMRLSAGIELEQATTANGVKRPAPKSELARERRAPPRSLVHERVANVRPVARASGLGPRRGH